LEMYRKRRKRRLVLSKVSHILLPYPPVMKTTCQSKRFYSYYYILCIYLSLIFLTSKIPVINTILHFTVARCQHAGADRGLPPACPPCAFCSSLPPSAQGGGEGRSVLNKCIAGHQVCPPSTVSSLWKSGPLRAASPGSPGKWYLLHHRKNVPQRSLLQPLCHLQKGERLQHGGGSDSSPSRPFPIRRIELL
jgi:hypothetical protein